MPNQSEPQHVLSLATFSGAKQGLAGCFLVSPNRPERRNTQRSGDRSSGVLTKVKPPERNPDDDDDDTWRSSLSGAQRN